MGFDALRLPIRYHAAVAVRRKHRAPGGSPPGRERRTRADQHQHRHRGQLGHVEEDMAQAGVEGLSQAALQHALVKGGMKSNTSLS